MCFPHEGNIVIIDQLTFISPESTLCQPSPLHCSYTQAVSPLPQVNYVATCSMSTSIDDLVGGVVHHVLGPLETYFSFGSLDMYFFHSVVLPFDENLMEVITSFDI